MRACLVIAALVAVAGPARADDAGPSPATAVELSGGITLGGVALVGTGILVGSRHPVVGLALGAAGGLAVLIGPSTGHWYAGNLEPFGGKLVLLGTVPVFATLLAAWWECGADKDHAQGCTPTVAYSLAAAGGATIVTGLVWDLATAGSDARHRRRIAIAPIRVPGGAGLAMAGRF